MVSMAACTRYLIMSSPVSHDYEVDRYVQDQMHDEHDLEEVEDVSLEVVWAVVIQVRLYSHSVE